MKGLESLRIIAYAILLALAGAFLLHTSGIACGYSPSPSISVFPDIAPVGENITISAQSFPPNANVVLEWSTANATWDIGGSPVPEVLGINTVPGQDLLANVVTNSTGGFSETLPVPVDNNGQHVIQAFVDGAKAPLSEASFTLVPSFYFSPSNGPVGTKITVYANGLGAHMYASAYHVLFDNEYIGYMTGITTHGQANFTFYVTGAVGPHTISVYNGYPGPAYLNSNQAPSAVSITSYDPPLIPFHGQFNITANEQSAYVSSGSFFIPPSILGASSLALILLAVAFFAMSGSATRKKIVAMLVIMAFVLGGAALVFLVAPNSGAISGNEQLDYTPQATVIRPLIVLPEISANSGPRMTVTPNVATVGTVVNVTGLGFPPNTVIPLSWATHLGSHVVGFVSAIEPLKNVTTDATGSFSFTMSVPYDLGGLHNITAPNIAPNGNATLYIERSVTISASQGPEGSLVTITMTGLGWTYQDNIAAIDYDNSFMGYVCGFNTNGNITLYLPITGAPGYHTIDIYPANYLGPTPPTEPNIAIYRYPILTPYDDPALLPVFHFSFLVTQGDSSVYNTNANGGITIGGVSS